MKNKKFMLIILLLAAVLVLAGCGGGEEVTVDEPVEEPIALLISGNVGEELTWTMEELQTMDTIEVDYTGKDGETETYTGVSLTVLLGDADPGADAETVVFTAADDYQAEAALGEVLVCADCVVAFDDGSLRVVMPGFSGKLQVKNLVQIGIQ